MNLIASTSATCVEGLGGMVPTNYAGERFDQNNEENFMQIEGIDIELNFTLIKF